MADLAAGVCVGLLGSLPAVSQGRPTVSSCVTPVGQKPRHSPGPKDRDKGPETTGCATAFPALLMPFDPGSDPKEGLSLIHI